MHARENLRKSGVGDVRVIDAHALIDAQQMRRGVQAGAQSRRAQDGGEHGGRGALAVGAGDVNGGIEGIRTPHAFGEHGNVLKIELGGAGLLRGSEFAAQGEQVFDGLVVVHMAPFLLGIEVGHSAAVRPGTDRARWRCNP
jgi:hypothetical protein